MATAKTEGLSDNALKLLRARFRMRQNRFSAITKDKQVRIKARPTFGACTSNPDDDPTVFEKIKTKQKPVKAIMRVKTLVVGAKGDKAEEEEKSVKCPYASVTNPYGTITSEISEATERSVRRTKNNDKGEGSESNPYGTITSESFDKTEKSVRRKKQPNESPYGNIPVDVCERTQKSVRRTKKREKSSVTSQYASLSPLSTPERNAASKTITSTYVKLPPMNRSTDCSQSPETTEARRRKSQREGIDKSERFSHRKSAGKEREKTVM